MDLQNLFALFANQGVTISADQSGLIINVPANGLLGNADAERPAAEAARPVTENDEPPAATLATPGAAAVEPSRLAANTEPGNSGKP